jgi:predicted transglutaminase-like cysteine proteinase
LAGSHLAEAGEAPPLPAWIGFCERTGADCAVDTGEPLVIPLSAEISELLDAVNRYVNRTVIAKTDLEHLGVVDRWDLPTDGIGDCEDLQLLKRKLLVEAGVPRRAMRMTVVLDSAGAGHAVLTVRTSDGDLLLDNLVPDVLPWRKAGYVFVKRESQHRVGWAWLEEPTIAVAVATAPN